MKSYATGAGPCSRFSHGLNGVTSFIKVDVATINPEDDEAKTEEKKKPEDEIVMLGVNAGDTLYAEVRDQHVEKFGSFLQNQAKALKESHANFTNKGTKKDLTEIHQFVKQIPVSVSTDQIVCHDLSTGRTANRLLMDDMRRSSPKICEVLPITFTLRS